MTKTTIQSFVPLQKLGEGTFSSVYKVRRVSDNGIYALKKIKIASLKQKQKANALNEIRILASITSENIVTYKEAFFDQNLKLLCIVMEWANGGDLLQKINDHKKHKTHFSQSQLWKIAFHLFKGLAVLHKNLVLHRDMKSANIFISNGVYKIGDLNVSKVISEQMMVKTQTGTPYYASPEVWRDEPYDHRSDIWSLGCIIYELCALKPPFLGDSLEELNRNIQKGRFVPIPSRYSSELKQLINKCLRLRPSERPAAHQVLQDGAPLWTKCQYYDIECDTSQDCTTNQKMLSTIKMPFDIKALNHHLPHAQYDKEQKNRSITLPAKENHSSSKKKLKNESSLMNSVQKKQQTIKPKQPLTNTEKPANQPLPERIKAHLQNVSQTPADKLFNRRPKYRIQTSIGTRQYKPILKHLQNMQMSGVQTKKARPLSCDLRKRQPKEIRPQTSKGRRIIRPTEIHSSLKKVQQPSFKEIQRYLVRPEPSYMRYMQQQSNKDRCRSAEYHKPVNSSYAELKKRLENREKALHHSALFNESKVRPPALAPISKSDAQLRRPEPPSHVPFINKYAYLKNTGQNRRENLEKQNRQYLQEIQNKILNGVNTKGKRCISINNLGHELQTQKSRAIHRNFVPYNLF